MQYAWMQCFYSSSLLSTASVKVASINPPKDLNGTVLHSLFTLSFQQSKVIAAPHHESKNVAVALCERAPNFLSSQMIQVISGTASRNQES